MTDKQGGERIVKTLRIAVVGCGVMADEWVKYTMKRNDCQIISLTDVRLEAAEKMAEKYGLVCSCYTDVKQAVFDQPDLLFDLTVPQAHEYVTTTAFGAGIDVFGEKPIAHDFDAARRIVEAARRSGRYYALMQNRRYLRQLRDMKAFLDTGVLGKPEIVTADFFTGPHFGGFRDTMAHPLIVEMAIHTMDQCRFLTDARPVSVVCKEFNPASSWFVGNCSALCTFEMSDGLVFSYRGCWCAEGIYTSWQSQWRLVCEKGSMTWDGFGTPAAGVPGDPVPGRFITKCVPMEVPHVYTGTEEHVGCLDAMFSAYLASKRAETDCEDNLYSVAMAFAAIRSAEEDRKVWLSELI